MARPAGAFQNNKRKLFLELRAGKTSNKVLAEALGVSSSYVDLLISSLEKDGLILRRSVRCKLANGWANRREIQFLTDTAPAAVACKLSDDDVVKIRQLYNEGETQIGLARLYDVRQPTIWAIVHHKSRKV